MIPSDRRRRHDPVRQELEHAGRDHARCRSECASDFKGPRFRCHLHCGDESEEYTGGANIASHVAEALGFRGIPAVRVETASSAGAAAVHVAYHGVAEGLSRLRELHQRLKPIGKKIWSNTLKQTDSFLSSSLR